VGELVGPAMTGQRRPVNRIRRGSLRGAEDAAPGGISSRPTSAG